MNNFHDIWPDSKNIVYKIFKDFPPGESKYAKKYIIFSIGLEENDDILALAAIIEHDLKYSVHKNLYDGKTNFKVWMTPEEKTLFYLRFTDEIGKYYQVWEE